MHARKSLLFTNHEVWIKKNESLFDVTMGSFDGAEICELVGLYLLYNMKSEFPELNCGLYRDDGLAYVENISGPQSDRLRKNVIQYFNLHGLQITIDINLTQVNFLDVTLDLKSEKYWPFRKPNDQPLYVNKSSNHPPSIINGLPKMIEKRISQLSCNEEEFRKVKNEYNNALSNSGYNYDINYTKTTPKKKTRKRNIIWFNPPFNSQVKTNVGRKFLDLVIKHFPSHHKYRKIFNKNNLKLSYSCTQNMKSVISSHNKRVLNEIIDNPNRDCNCIRKEKCPLNEHCLQKAIVYNAKVTVDEEINNYIGCTENTFKTRYGNHKSSFCNQSKINDTCLSKYVWSTKGKDKAYDIKWSILQHATPYRCGGRTCDLCLTEKLLILQSETSSLINKKSEILSKCRHKNKYKLGVVK